MVAFRGPRAQAALTWSSGQLYACLETDADGRFDAVSRVDASEAIALHSAVGCSEWTTIPPGDSPLVLRVVPGNVVEGTVRDAADGAPLEEVTVEWSQTAPGASGPRARTDASGRYRIAGLPPGMEFRPDVGVTPRIAGLVRDGGGPPIQFEGVGGTVLRDLRVVTRPGVTVTWRLRVADGLPLPEAIDVVHRIVMDDPAGEGDLVEATGGVFADEDVALTSTSGLVDGVLRTCTRRAWTATVDPRDPTITIFLPRGRNRVQLSADQLATALAPRLVAGRGPSERAEAVLGTRPRVFVQLLDGARLPLPRADVQVGVAVTTEQAGSQSSMGTGGAATDAAGRAEITGLLPEVDGEPEDPGTRTTITLTLGGAGLRVPAESLPSWTPAGLAAALADPRNAGGLVIPVSVDVLPPDVPTVFQFVDDGDRPIAGLAVRLLEGRLASRETDAAGRVTFEMPAGRRAGLAFGLPPAWRMDPLREVEIPATAPVRVPLHRILRQSVMVEIAGVPATSKDFAAAGLQPTARALDAQGHELREVRAMLSIGQDRWRISIVAPGTSRRLFVTFRGQQLEIDVPDGTPIDVPVWSVR